MPRNYERIALTESEIERLCEKADAARFASVGPDGLPHVVPIAFARVDGELCFETDADAVKTRNVRATGVGAAVVDAGADDYGEHRGVQWRGPARVVEDDDFVARIERALFGTTKSVSDAGGHERVKVALTPEREVSWDFRKVG